MRILYFISILSLSCSSLNAQTLGGAATYNFLKLPSTPLQSALGGNNVSYQSDDIGLSLFNPALLNSSLHSRTGVSFNAFFAGVKAWNLAGGYYKENWGTTFGASLFYVDYGNIDQTDAGGNIQGSFRPRDYVLQMAASRQYLEKWHYGLTVKYIYSDLGAYQSSALAFDAGLLYVDSTRLLSLGLVAKNMGGQLKTYNGEQEELPFDLQIGITKRLEKAPLGFSLTWQQAHLFEIGANDSTFNEPGSTVLSPNFFNKASDHLILATHFYIGEHLEANLGYNRLRRKELNIGNTGNGLNGFSAGFSVNLNKIQFQYARSYYQRNAAYNQIAVNAYLNKLFNWLE